MPTPEVTRVQEAIIISLDEKMLPKRITQKNAHSLAGESAYWYCSACKKWRTSKITPDGGITCSVCGGAIDWKKHQPTLSYKSRHKRVADLWAQGSELRRSYDEVEKRYGDFIEQTYIGMSARAKDNGWRYFSNAWRTMDGVADYLLTAPDAPSMDIPHAYSAQGLQRRYYDPRRKCNVSSLTDLDLQPTFDGSDVQFSDQEMAEIISLHSGYSAPFYDVYFAYELLECISDPLEHAIAHDLAQGLTKRDIERKYRLSESKVRTVIRHIAKGVKEGKITKNRRFLNNGGTK